MSIALITKLVLIITGVIIMTVTFILHAKKKLTVDLSVAWEGIGFALILIGVVPVFSSWCELLGRGTMIAMFLVGALAIWGLFEVSILISRLTMKVRELAMQVSLLNQENERMLQELSELTGKSVREL